MTDDRMTSHDVIAAHRGKDPGHHAHLAAEVVKALGGLTLESCHYSAFDTVAVRGGQTSTYIGERSACRWVSDWTPEVAP